jgi:hypothetical protein
MNVPITARLIQHLESVFPNQIPQNNITVEELRLLQGQQHVIEYIRSLYDNQSFEV